VNEGNYSVSEGNYSLRKLLREGAAAVEAPLGEEQVEKFLLYLEEIREGNKKVNLTSTSNRRELILKHFIDSLSCVPLLPLAPDISLLDVGSGAGFPGLVLKIYRPVIHLALLEASGKKCAFLASLVERMKLNATELLRGRAEVYGQDIRHREHYQVVVSRAVAPLRVLAEYCLPFLKMGGLFICQKGPKGYLEIREAEEALSLLGGQVSGLREITLPAGQEKRLLISLTKTSPTPLKYPRPPGIPRKRPLRRPGSNLSS